MKVPVLLSEFRHSTDWHERSLNTVLDSDSFRRQMLLATTSPLTELLDQVVHLDKRKMISKPPYILCFRSDYSHLSSASSKYSLNVLLSCLLNFLSIVTSFSCLLSIPSPPTYPQVPSKFITSSLTIITYAYRQETSIEPAQSMRCCCMREFLGLTTQYWITNLGVGGWLLPGED